MIPVVYIHLGSIPEYLILSITQAAKFNKNIFLITDARFTHPGVTVRNADLYRDDVHAFRKVYQHMSTNLPEFEMICIERWIMLSAFMREEGPDACFYADSDVMLYADVADLYSTYPACDAAYTMAKQQGNLRWSASACCSYWTRNGIDHFAGFIMKMYEPAGIAQLGKKWKYHQEHEMAGGVCDMTLLYLFAETIRFINLSEVRNGVAFDQNMLSSENYFEQEYRMTRRRGEDRFQKKIRWRKGLPYASNLVLQKEIRFAALTEYAKLALQEKSATEVLKFRVKKILGRI